MDDRIKFIQSQLANRGSMFSYEEIEEILKVVQDVALKLIITNVPKEVYTNKIAQDAFESLFKSFDNQSTFYYLPSFSRAQVYMNRPEGALCARLQVQGWKLPESILAQCPDHSAESSSNEGISCYIDQVDELYDSSGHADDPCNQDGNLDEESDEDFECTCATGSWDKPPSMLPSTLSDETHAKHRAGLSDLLDPIVSSTNSCALPTKRPTSPQIFSSDRRMGSLDGDTASDASGDDGSLVTTPPHGSLFTCLRHRRRRPLPMQHLAPPKPPRLFLLSPPCSPPVGWEPKPESEPVINYELLEALASLAPGETFELQPRNQDNNHPSIVITPCETKTPVSKASMIRTPCPQRKS